SGTVPEPSPAEAAFRNLRAGEDGRSLSFEVELGGDEEGDVETYRVRMELAPDAPELVVELDAADRQRPMKAAPFLDGFVLDTPTAVAAVADYSNGHVYPLAEDPFPRPRRPVYEYDMPWVGICDLEAGFGYTMIVEHPEDADLAFEPTVTAQGTFHVPRVEWKPSMGSLAY